MIRFLGVGSAFNYKETNNSLYIKLKDELLIIDMGFNVWQKLVRENILDGVSRVYILITHLHGDHIGSLSNFLVYIHYNFKEVSVNIVYKDFKSIKELLKLMNTSEDYYNLYQDFDALNLNKGPFKDFKITSYHQKHSLMNNAYGYLFETPELNFFYSGDAEDIPGYILKLLCESKLDYLFQDTCFSENKKMPHLRFEDLLKLIPKEYRDKVYCMHQDIDFNKEEALFNGFKVTSNLDEYK